MICKRCSIGLLTYHAWHQLTKEQRKASAAKRHESRELCRRCYRLSILDGTIDDYPKKNRGYRETIEDYFDLYDNSVTRNINIENIAKRLGMTFHALEQAVVRYNRENRKSA